MKYHLTNMEHPSTSELYWGILNQETLDIVYLEPDQNKVRKVCSGLRKEKCPCPDFWMCRNCMNVHTAINKYM